MRGILFALLITGGTLAARLHIQTRYASVIAQARTQATPPARRVLNATHRMVTRGVIVRGSCWDYLDAAFTRAGYPPSKRRTVYRTGKHGPYAPVARVRPGDWLYFINHDYGGVEHSGLFIGWVNRARIQGLVLSYGGKHRKQPGRYRVYDLRSIYQIIRVPQQ